MPRIGPKRPLKWYLKEWRVHKGLTAERMADRLDTNKGQISKLERGEQRMNDDWIYGYAEALGIEPADLLKPPDAPSVDDLLRGATPEQYEQVRSVIRIIVGKK